MDIIRQRRYTIIPVMMCAFCFLAGCRVMEKGGQTVIHECIDKRISEKTPPIIRGMAQETTERGIKSIIGEYGFHGISGLLALFGLGTGGACLKKYTEIKKNGNETKE